MSCCALLYKILSTVIIVDHKNLLTNDGLVSGVTVSRLLSSVEKLAMLMSSRVQHVTIAVDQQTTYPSGLTSSSADKGLEYHGQSFGTPHGEEQAILSHVMTSDLGTTSGHANVNHQGQETNYGGLKEQDQTDQTFYLSVITSELPPTSGDKDLQGPVADYETQKRQLPGPLPNIVASEVLSTPGDKDGEMYVPQYKELETRTILQSNKTPLHRKRGPRLPRSCKSGGVRTLVFGVDCSVPIFRTGK